MALDESDLLAAALVLDAVVYDQVIVGAVVEQRRDHVPEAARRDFLAAQEVADGVMADGLLAFEVVSQASAGVVARRAIRYATYCCLVTTVHTSIYKRKS